MARSAKKTPATMTSPKRPSPVAEIAPRSPLIGKPSGDDDLMKLAEGSSNSGNSPSLLSRFFNRRTATLLVAGVAVAVGAAGRAGVLGNVNSEYASSFSSLFVAGDKSSDSAVTKLKSTADKPDNNSNIVSRKKRRLASKTKSAAKTATKSGSGERDSGSRSQTEEVEDGSGSPAGSPSGSSKSEKSKSASKSASKSSDSSEKNADASDESGEESEDEDESDEEDKPQVYKPSVDARNAAVSSFAFLSFLLLLGKTLRVLVKPLRDLYLPSSVIGGLFGLVLLTITASVGPKGSVEHQIPEEGDRVVNQFFLRYYCLGWKELPEILICIIFAAVFIGVEVPPMKAIWEGSGPQIMYGQIVTHGLWFWGLLTGWIASLLWLWFKSSDASYFWVGDEDSNMPNCYGMAMYLGFEGGHGTVSGLKNEFETMQKWTEGSSIALAMATTGLVGATLWGVFLINMAHKKGWLELHTDTNAGECDPMLLVGVYSPEKKPVMGYETVVSDSIDTLTLHGALVGLACFFGYGIQRTLILVEDGIGGVVQEIGFGQNFPLFPLCMLGGILVDRLLRSIKMSTLVDHNCMQRVSGIALDYLVCAAIAMMQLDAISSWPYAMIVFAVLNIVGFCWHFFCILFLAPRMLPDCWFERAIFEVGHSMGTTANGILLLKIVDPHGETAAHSAVAFKLFFHEPLMGVWVAIVVCVMKMGDYGAVWPTMAIMCASGGMLVFWFCMYFFYFKQKYESDMLKDRRKFLSTISTPEDGGSHRGSTVSEELRSRASTTSDRDLARNTGPHIDPTSTMTTDLGHLASMSSRMLRQRDANGHSVIQHGNPHSIGGINQREGSFSHSHTWHHGMGSSSHVGESGAGPASQAGPATSSFNRAPGARKGLDDTMFGTFGGSDENNFGVAGVPGGPLGLSGTVGGGMDNFGGGHGGPGLGGGPLGASAGLGGGPLGGGGLAGNPGVPLLGRVSEGTEMRNFGASEEERG